jgi:hypothetical protein
MQFKVIRQALRFLLAVPVLAAIGVSQILYAWAGTGFVQTYVYPSVCFLMAIGCGYLGYEILVGEAKSE